MRAADEGLPSRRTGPIREKRLGVTLLVLLMILGTGGAGITKIDEISQTERSSFVRLLFTSLVTDVLR